MCEYLNETISPIQQSEALGISVDLYNRLVEIRKNNLDYLTVMGKWNLMVSIKKELCDGKDHGFHCELCLL